MFAAQAGLAVAGGVAQYQAQSAAYDLAKDQSKLNSELAKTSALGQYAALAARQNQEREAAAASIDDTARRASEARAAARTSAGEAGVAGASVDALLSDYTRQEYDFQVRTTRNQSFLDAQFGREREAVRTGLQSNLINSMPNQPKPNLAQIGIGVGAQSLSAFQQSFYDPYTRKYNFKSGTNG